MHFFAEARCILLRLYAGLCENIDHLSPAEARAGTEVGNYRIVEAFLLLNLVTFQKV